MKSVAYEQMVAAAEKRGDTVVDINETSLATPRPLDVMNIQDGDTEVLPEDYVVRERTITMNGTTNKAYYVIMESGKSWWLGSLFRTATAADGSGRVKPTGNVVEAMQSSAKTKDVLDKLKGQPITFKSQLVRAKGRTEDYDASIWDISCPALAA